MLLENTVYIIWFISLVHRGSLWSDMIAILTVSAFLKGKIRYSFRNAATDITWNEMADFALCVGNMGKQLGKKSAAVMPVLTKYNIVLYGQTGEMMLLATARLIITSQVGPFLWLTLVIMKFLGIQQWWDIHHGYVMSYILSS